MDILFTSFFWVTLGQIIMINILLSGDNAVVIALASRNLPAKQQKQAILLGSLGAIVLRVILTFFAVVLLSFPYLKIVGAVLLVWIGIKMLIPEDGEDELDAHAGLWAAIKTIIIADFIMSLDNVLGVAAAAKGNTLLLIIGLAISIPLIVYGSTLILKLMERWGFIVVAGAGLLGWVAGEMFVTDPAISNWVDTQAHWAHTLTPVVATMIVITVGMWMARASREHAPLAVALPPEGAAQVRLSDAELGEMARVSQQASLQPMPLAAQAATIAMPPVLDAVTPMPSALDAVTPIPSPASDSIVEDTQCDNDPPSPAPVGYRWVASPWKTNADGTRDYAAMHGKNAFYRLVPGSSRLRRPPPH